MRGDGYLFNRDCSAQLIPVFLGSVAGIWIRFQFAIFLIAGGPFSCTVDIISLLPPARCPPLVALSGRSEIFERTGSNWGLFSGCLEFPWEVSYLYLEVLFCLA